jgi:DNA adenine methylase
LSSAELFCFTGDGFASSIIGKMNETVQPFLKWPGGKRWLAGTIARLFEPTRIYVEPFLGAGAVFFSLRPCKGHLSDVNEDLISSFIAVRDDADAVIRHLSKLRINKRVFREVRAAVPKTVLDRAVRLIYLNRTAFNGIFRVNRNGEFNVPFGCKKGTKVCDIARIRECSRALNGIVVQSTDFLVALEKSSSRDAFYIDPPYTVKHDNNGFRRYNERIFSWKDQLELALKANRLAADGAQVVVSNSSHKDVAALYLRRNFRAVEVQRSSCMAADATYRGRCKELLLVSRSISESTEIKALLDQMSMDWIG